MAEAQTDPVPAQCRRAVLASGLALGLVFALALSGAASITLMFDASSFQETIKGFEGFVLDTVRMLKPAIRFLHTYGGYAAFVLAGWAGIEMFWLYRALRGSGKVEVRAFATRILVLGVIGGAVLTVTVGVLTVSGTAASVALRGSASPADEGPEPLNPMARSIADPSATGDSLVNEHTRRQTYMVGIAALLLAAAASQARRAAKAAKEATPAAT